MYTNILKYWLLLGFVILFSCSGINETSDENELKYDIPIVDFEGVRHFFSLNNDTTYVLNFWATWCAPCVKEIPYFEKIGKEFADKKLKIILINLDFPNHYESRFIPFLEQNQIKSKVIMLDDPDSNRWINEVSPKWTGSIPATVIYNKDMREFYEKEFTYEELENTVQKFLN